MVYSKRRRLTQRGLGTSKEEKRMLTKFMFTRFIVWSCVLLLAMAGAQDTTGTDTTGTPADPLPEETPVEGEALSPLGAAFCTQPLSYWLATPEWPVESLVIAGQEYAQEELLALLAQTVPEGEVLKPDIAMAQQLVVFKLNVAIGALPTTEAALAAILAEDLLQLSFNGLPASDVALSETDLNLMMEQTPVLEEFIAAYDCANVPAPEELPLAPLEEGTGEETTGTTPGN
jgi:hypothetical protein